MLLPAVLFALEPLFITVGLLQSAIQNTSHGDHGPTCESLGPHSSVSVLHLPRSEEFLGPVYASATLDPLVDQPAPTLDQLTRLRSLDLSDSQLTTVSPELEQPTQFPYLSFRTGGTTR